MKKLLPPSLFVLFSAGIPFLCWGLGAKHYMLYPYNMIGSPFVIVGLGMAVWGKRLFRAMGTNINTFDEPDILVTSGLYRISRNPMYLGFVIALSGVAILFRAAIPSLFVVVLFFLITNLWYIKYEEKAMQVKFGKKYEDYCEITRRWI